MAQYPDISYTHILSELSVNRRDPCEVIRELISNSYDAEASRIEIYPLLQYKGFIYFDNGTGMSETKEINGITPYRAFFSVGKSTKILGDAIGYKCQGSKLCFASSKFSLITRCRDEEYWRSVSIDNPKDTLNPQYNIESQPDHHPWQTLKNLFNKPDKRTVNILDCISEEFFTKKYINGSLIVVQGFDIREFSQYFATKKNKGKEYFYLKEYIRFNTRHGDMRILRPNETGFPESKALNFQQSPGYNDKCELHLWIDNRLQKIESGYPYLSKPTSVEELQIKSPFKVSKLRNGNFYGRGATSFEFEDRTYCLSLAIDGNGRALNKYEELDRQGSNGKRSGIRLTDQRGAFVCSEGVKICQYNEIFEHSKLIEDYGVLGTANGQAHYILMINGSFEVVTNRNSLTDAALTILKYEDFAEKIKNFLDLGRQKLIAFNELIERLNKEDDKYKLDAYIKQRDRVKDKIQDRTRFMIKDIEQLNGKWLVAPSTGEEHWVGALYTMFAHLVPPDSQYAHLWMRPRTFSGIGIDSLAVEIEENSLASNVHKGLEYKWTFSDSEVFNHPFIVTNQIVCWEMTIPEIDKQISDSYNYYGYTSRSTELDGIGYEIIKLTEHSGDFHGGTIKVISLKNLIDKTFKCEWETPPPKVIESKKGRKK
jgi:Histidine kinase-, DNA gyrase B-, and HSP90-like ATPase